MKVTFCPSRVGVVMEHLMLHLFGNCHNEWQVVMAPLMEAMPFVHPWFTTLKERLLG